MKKNILLLLISFGVFAQQNKKPYPTQAENEIWLNEYRNIQSDSGRSSEIKKKIYSDTLYYNYKKRIILDNPRDPKKHICKVLFVIEYENKYFDFDLLENPKLIKVIKSIKRVFALIC